MWVVVVCWLLFRDPIVVIVVVLLPSSVVVSRSAQLYVIKALLC